MLKNIDKSIYGIIVLLAFVIVLLRVYGYVEELRFVNNFKNTSFRIHLYDEIMSYNSFHRPLENLEEFNEYLEDQKCDDLKKITTNNSLSLIAINDSLSLYYSPSNGLLNCYNFFSDHELKKKTLVLKIPNYSKTTFFINEKRIIDTNFLDLFSTTLADFYADQEKTLPKGYFLYNSRVLLNIERDPINNKYSHNILHKITNTSFSLNYQAEYFIILLKEHLDNLLKKYNITYGQFYLTVPIRSDSPPPNF